MSGDFDFEAAAKSVALMEKARRAVESRRYTDRPGDGWALTDVASLPQYVGTQGKVMISATDDGEKYEVMVFTYAGRQVHSAAYKTLDAAFRNGVKFADQKFETPAPVAVEPTAEEVSEQPTEEPVRELAVTGGTMYQKGNIIRGAVVGTAVAATLTLAATAQTQDMTPAPYASAIPSASSLLPVPRPSATHEDRDGTRAPLTPRPQHVAAQSPRATKSPEPSRSWVAAGVTIQFYKDCDWHAQECIDAGDLTYYAGRILAGHDYMGYAWLATVPTGTLVRVASGPVAGTYRVYGHLRLNRQGGDIPSFGSADLVLQSCQGSGTGFSLLHRI